MAQRSAARLQSLWCHAQTKPIQRTPAGFSRGTCTQNHVTLYAALCSPGGSHWWGEVLLWSQVAGAIVEFRKISYVLQKWGIVLRMFRMEINKKIKYHCLIDGSFWFPARIQSETQAKQYTERPKVKLCTPFNVSFADDESHHATDTNPDCSSRSS